jgi:hypothetical protein
MITGNSRAETLSDAWQGLIELALERGQTPLLNLGAGAGLLENIPTLVALHAFAQTRRDLATPLVVAGGAPIIWLAALLHDVETGPDRDPTQSPPLQVVYSGPDLATQSATIELFAHPGASSQIPQTPPGLANLLAPASQGGAPLWETLPLFLAATPAGDPQPTPTPAPGDPWLGWFGVGLTLLLVILALLV